MGNKPSRQTILIENADRRPIICVLCTGPLVHSYDPWMYVYVQNVCDDCINNEPVNVVLQVATDNGYHITS